MGQSSSLYVFTEMTSSVSPNVFIRGKYLGQIISLLGW